MNIVAHNRALSELGLRLGASLDDIKSAYRDLAKKYHPDLNPGDLSAIARFRRLNEAYKSLTEASPRSTVSMFAGVIDPEAAMALIWQDILPDF